MIKSVQTTLGGMKENSQSLKVPKQSWGHEEKSKGSKNFEHAKKKKKPIQWCSKPNEENKNKKKEPKLNTGGHDKPFWKDIQMTKG